MIRVDLALNVRRLRLQGSDLVGLRVNEQEPARQAENEHGADDDSDQRSGRKRLEALHDRVHVDLHEPGAPATLMSAAIENWTTS